MNYEEKCTEMMIHMGENFSSPGMAHLIAAFADGIARTIALVQDHDSMHEHLDELCVALHKAACEYHKEIHKAAQDSDAVDAETFLRDVFNPGRFHG